VVPTTFVCAPAESFARNGTVDNPARVSKSGHADTGLEVTRHAHAQAVEPTVALTLLAIAVGQ
jgi:hypothetical protein